MHKRRGLEVTIVLLVSSLLGLPVSAQQEGPAERGREIAEEADRRDRGFGDYQARLEMTLEDRRGRETVRELDLLVLELPDGQEQSLVTFETPRDIRGTALLTYSYEEQENDQWLYLPALRRTKRIAATGRSSPFMGSEFAYEDLVRSSTSQYDYLFLGEEELDGTPCFVLERYARYEGTGYSKERLWIDTAEYRVLQIDYWDLRDRELKTLSLSGYERYLENTWRASEARMLNHRTGEATLLRWLDYRFQTGLTESQFTRAAMGRVN
jgi:outer membrane lipoprotein-sorting protein